MAVASSEEPGLHRELTDRIIACAIEVHRHLGPGLTENVYEAALAIEFDLHGLPYVRQVVIPAQYKGYDIGRYRIDFVVGNAVVVEVKSAEHLAPVFAAQVLTYLRITGCRVGLLVNFNADLLSRGVKRLVL
jgi:GxxExxY protein